MKKLGLALVLSLMLSPIFSLMNAQENAGLSFAWPEGKKAAVVLTCDDGLDCHLDVAAPALEGYGFCGTFYVSQKMEAKSR